MPNFRAPNPFIKEHRFTFYATYMSKNQRSADVMEKENVVKMLHICHAWDACELNGSCVDGRFSNVTSLTGIILTMSIFIEVYYLASTLNTASQPSTTQYILFRDYLSMLAFTITNLVYPCRAVSCKISSVS